MPSTNDWDIGEIFHTDLFSANSANNNSGGVNSSPNPASTPGLTSPSMSSSMSSASSSSSREPSPLATPPSQSLGERFPDFSGSNGSNTALTAGPSSTSGNPTVLGAPRTAIANTGIDDGDDLFGGYFDPSSNSDMMMGFTGVKGGFGDSTVPSFGMDHDAFGTYMTGLEETFGFSAGSNRSSSSSNGGGSFVGSSPNSNSSNHSMRSNTSNPSSNPTSGGNSANNSNNGAVDSGLAPFSNMGMAGFGTMDLDSMAMGVDVNGMSLPMSLNMGMMSGMPLGMDALMQLLNQTQADGSVAGNGNSGANGNAGINPQLVDSPAPLVSMGEDSDREEEEEEDGSSDEEMADETVSPTTRKARGGRKKLEVQVAAVSTGNTNRRSARKSSSAASPLSAPSPATSDEPRLTLTIAPVKVGGRGTTTSGNGMGRRGTVLSGGIAKRSSATAGLSVASGAIGTSNTSSASVDKENTDLPTPAKRGRKPASATTAASSSSAPATAKGRPGRKPKEVEEVSTPVSPLTANTPVASPITIPAPTTSAYSQLAGTLVQPSRVSTTVTPATGGAGANLGVGVGIGVGIPHSSSGLGIVPPPLPNGQRNLTPVDLGIGKKFAFAIPMGTFNNGVSNAFSSGSGAQGNGGGRAKGQQGGGGFRAMSEFGDDEDEMAMAMAMAGDGDEGGGVRASLPADWRPSPEVFAKMSSKEKRQLRNKISARNFRVRRKEYISTLEGDIAERDRLLEAIRSELGSSRNENVALRQEVENLKRVLLNGRGVPVDGQNSVSAAGQLIEGLDLPPPAPLPEKSAAEVLAARASSSSASALIKPNTQKDLPSSPRIHAHSQFWGGSGGAGAAHGHGMFAGGVTAVHTTFVPAPSVSLVGLGLGEVGRRGRDMNINPNLNGGAARREEPHGRDVHGKEGVDGFEGFAESNMFTMKNLDAYRMHLWGKMAAQYHQHQQSSGNQYLSQQQQQQSQQQQQQQQQAYQQQQQQLTGLASRLGRSWFQTSSLSDASNNNSSSNSNNNSLPRTPFSNFSNFSTAGGNGGGPTYHYSPLLSAILSGKGGVGGGSGSGYSYSSASFKRHPPSSASSVSGGSGDSQGQGQKLGQQEQQQKQQQAQKQAQEQVQKQAQAAMLAAVASQTILRKMGQAFWDAFAGHGGGEVVGASGSGSGRGMLIKHFDAPSAGSSSSSASSSSSPSSSSYLASSPPASSTSPSTYSASSTSSPSSYSPNPSSYSPRPAFKPWDADKVKKVLEGKAVVRVVDVDQLYRLGEGGSVTGSAKVHGSGSTSTSTTTTGTNVSQGGSLSVPSSPVIKAAAPVVQCNLTAACSALEEKMKSLRL